MSDITKPHLNEVEISTVANLAESIQSDPKVAATTWSAQVRWRGGFRSEAKIRDFAPQVSDEPELLGGTDTGPNPVEQVLGALGNCLAVGYAANATAAGIELKDITIDLQGNLNLQTFLGLKDDNAGYSNISVRVSIDSDAPKEEISALHEKVISTSPVGHTLSRAVPVQIDLN